MPQLTTSETLNLLRQGEMSLAGEFVWGSNYTFLVDITAEQGTLKGVYKPSRGERPLWDFPRASLAHREASAFIVDRFLGWRLVPPTVYRRAGIHGPGSVQLFIEHDPEYHYFNFSPADRQRLRPTVLFDFLINNADRKGSHVLVDAEAHIWLIDHGICFHEDDKLRTVIWDFAGEAVPTTLQADLVRLLDALTTDSPLSERLEKHLRPAEISALAARAEFLSTMPVFPEPPPNRRAYPWPPL